MSDDRAAIEALRQLIAHRRVVLFVGAGVSAMLGLPTWAQLMAHMARDLGYDEDILITPGTNYLTLAEFYRIKKGNIGPLRSWMDQEWSVDRETIKKSKVHELIVNLKFPFIYTTNYDRNLEHAYEVHGRPFSKIANVNDMSNAHPTRDHIVKLHGDFDDDETIVLTETDYYRRLGFDSPLDVKFRADTLGRPILFVGYSLTDVNLRLLLYKLSETWKASRHERSRPKVFLFLLRPDPVQETVLENWGITTITDGPGDPETALERFLTRLC